MKKQKKAIILLSGGLDSATVLAIALKQGYQCYALSFNYGQRSQAELVAAAKLVKLNDVKHHKILDFNLGMFGGSALTDSQIEVPVELGEGIPVTYVPARNTIFLSLALGWAEVVDASRIFVGVNAVDYSGYPDCRPEYIEAFQAMADLATRAGVEGHGCQIEAPLVTMTKSEIIKTGSALGVDYGMTLSCYQADDNGRACRVCDSCRLRKKGFEDAAVSDPTLYI